MEATSENFSNQVSSQVYDCQQLMWNTSAVASSSVDTVTRLKLSLRGSPLAKGMRLVMVSKRPGQNEQ
jgi:hypothetical protein